MDLFDFVYDGLMWLGLVSFLTLVFSLVIKIIEDWVSNIVDKKLSEYTNINKVRKKREV